MDSEAYELSLSESSCTEQAKIANPACSKKKKRSAEPESKLDDALDKLIAINKGARVFETSGENVVKQIKEFPEEETYQIIADIQLMLSKRKMGLLRKDHEAKFKRVSVEIVSQNSNSNPSSDILRSTMSHTDILEEESLF